MPKRRSSTRVGRKHPRPVPPPVDQRQASRRYLVSQPVLVDDTVCRIVRANETHIEVQEWHGMYWQPSSRPLCCVEEGMPASHDLLESLGIPSESWPGEVVQRWVAPELRRLSMEEGASLLHQVTVS